MPAISASAPGKIILFGEHAVVYGRPAIAVPVSEVRAKAIIRPEPQEEPGSVRIQAPVIGLDAHLEELPLDDPLATAVRNVLSTLGISRPPAMTIRVTSTIPVASGLGSGAAVSIAINRALSTFLGSPLQNDVVSALAFEVEKLHHGTPSGIDNTVITFAKPVYFQRTGESLTIETFRVAQPFTLVIADTGVPSLTALAVADVRQAWLSKPERFENLFDRIGEIVQKGRAAIEEGSTQILGALMNENQHLLRELGVSSPDLERLVETAIHAGAPGAKLSGGGRGGNMIALVNPGAENTLAQALLAAGARRTIITTISDRRSLI